MAFWTSHRDRSFLAISSVCSSNPPSRRRFQVGHAGYDPSSAIAYCTSLGSSVTLASIRNSNDNSCLGAIKPQPDRSNGMWVGGHRTAISNPYFWLDGWTSTTPYNYFCSGSPQNVEYYTAYWSHPYCVEDFSYSSTYDRSVDRSVFLCSINIA